jgi:hypothetical protein
MLRLTRLHALAAVGLASAFAVTPASAQCRLCDQPTTVRQEDSPKGDVQLQIETNLSFDQLILAGPGMGAATIRPDGSISSQGAVTQMGPRAMVGTVLVHGDPGRPLRIDLPRRIELYSMSGGRLTLEDVSSDVEGAPHLDAAGNLSFRFGGKLIVTGDTDGHYRGDLPITVEYAEDSSSAGSLTGH